MLKIGQKVRVKSWERMEREYGLDEDGNIITPATFTESMSKFCGKIYEISEVDPLGFVTYKLAGDVPEYYYWDDKMLEPLLGLRLLVEKRRMGNV